MNVAQFLDRLTPTDDGCLVYVGPTAGSGYGVFSIRKRVMPYAHRYAYELFVGSIPSDREIDHLCQNRRCVNPNHLEAVTPEENRRRVTERRTTCPQGHPYNESNTHIDKSGSRHCRTCDRIRHKAAWDKKRGAA